MTQLNRMIVINSVVVAAAVQVIFESCDSMEVTVTRSFLDVVSMLTEAFSDAVKQQLSKRDLPTALYVVHNQLDKRVELNLIESDFTIDDAVTRSGVQVVLEPGATVGLKGKSRDHIFPLPLPVPLRFAAVDN